MPSVLVVEDEPAILELLKVNLVDAGFEVIAAESAESARELIDVVQPDVGRVGGLTEAKRVAMHARDRGLVVVPHCWKSAIGIAASAHLAAVAPTCTYIEFLPRELADSALRRDLCSVELPVVDGRIPLPTTPGLGVTLNEEALHRFRV